MQQLAIIDSGKVLATHNADQQITFAQYPTAEKIMLMKEGERVKVRDDEPTLDRVVTYSVNTPSVIAELSRLKTTFEGINRNGILTLDNKGSAEIIHNLNSKWYAVIITPLDGAMPDIHIVCQKDKCSIKGGANNGRITYALTLIAPPKGRENQILADPY